MLNSVTCVLKMLYISSHLISHFAQAFENSRKILAIFFLHCFSEKTLKSLQNMSQILCINYKPIELRKKDLLRMLIIP